MAKSRIEKTARRSALDEIKKDEMLAILIRNRDAFESVRDVLSVRNVNEIGAGHGLVWQVVRNFYDEHRQLPPKGALVAELHNEIAGNESLLEEDERGAVDEFIEYAFDDAEHGKNISKSKVHCDIAITTCRQLLEEQAAADFSDTLLMEGTIPINLSEELERQRSHLDLIGSLSADDLGKPFPDGWDTQERVKLFSCGVPVLDTFMGGGWRGGEVILFMGPYGSCKTTMTVHGVAQTMTNCHQEWLAKRKRNPDAKRPLVVLIFTEGTKNEYRERLLSHLASIPRKRLSQMDSLDDLADNDRPGRGGEGTEYEKKLFKGRDSTFYCEKIRAAGAIKMANKHLLLIDCTDSDDSHHRIGRGGIPELAGLIRTTMRKRKDCYPYCFWIDHASALADRIMEGQEIADKKYLTTLLRVLPRQCGDLLAKPFMAPVALIHQLSGEANARGVAAEHHHADGSDCRSIGMYVDFAFTTGKTDESSMCLFSCTKHRREPPTPRIVVHVNGTYNRVDDYSATHMLDPTGRTIIQKQDLATYTNAAKYAPRKHSQLPTE